MKNSTLKPHEGIELNLSDEMVQRDILLLSDDSKPRCRKLLKANAKTQPEEMENPSKRITDDYRGGGGVALS